MADALSVINIVQFNQHVLPYIQLVISIDDVTINENKLFFSPFLRPCSNFLALDSIISSNLVNDQHSSVIDIMMYPRILKLSLYPIPQMKHVFTKAESNGVSSV